MKSIDNKKNFKDIFEKLEELHKKYNPKYIVPEPQLEVRISYMDKVLEKYGFLLFAGYKNKRKQTKKV